MPKFAKPLKGRHKLKNLEIKGYSPFWLGYRQPRKVTQGAYKSAYIYLKNPNSKREICFKLENVSEIN